jgi:hypothetical protein
MINEVRLYNFRWNSQLRGAGSPYHVCRSPSGNYDGACHRVWRVVGVRVGLPHHDGEVEGVVEDDAVLELCVRATAHVPIRRRHGGVPRVLQRRSIHTLSRQSQSLQTVCKKKIDIKDTSRK